MALMASAPGSQTEGLPGSVCDDLRGGGPVEPGMRPGATIWGRSGPTLPFAQ